jgi:hypothetical protein
VSEFYPDSYDLPLWRLRYGFPIEHAPMFPFPYTDDENDTDG